MANLRVTCFALLATGLLASAGYAQGGTKPLDLAVPPSSGFPAAGAGGSTPASTTPANTTATGTAPTNASAAPGVYFGDTSGAKGAANDPDDATDSCDDATYNKPQVHGSVSAGVAAGNHVSGNYQAAAVNISKRRGDCKHSSGNMSITVSGSQSRFADPRH